MLVDLTPMGRIILGILFIGTGFAMSFASNWFLSSFGRIGWAEEHLGAEGGSRLAYVLLGIGFMIFGLMLATGQLGSLVDGVFK